MDELEIQVVTNAIAFSITNWGRVPSNFVVELSVSDVEKFKHAARIAIEHLDEYRANTLNKER